MMHSLLSVAAEKSALVWLLGALHPGIVHFPIGLLVAAALFELLQIVRKRPEASPATAPLIYLAAVCSLPAVLFGFMLAEHGGNEGSTVDLHKWLGIASATAALAAAGCAWKSKTSRGALLGLRVTTLLGAAFVLGAGYLGGEMTMSEGHILKPLRALFGRAEAKSDETKKESVGETKEEGVGKPAEPVADKVDFAKEIAPIIKDMCFKCHGGEKVKGKFKMNTKALAMEGGESGKAIIPKKPSLSKFYTSLADPDEDVLMPPPKEKARPSKEQIERVKKWIEQGAEWPEGLEFKK